MLAVINASPFHIGKGYARRSGDGRAARACGLPLIYAHLVGGQDELIFEGHSFALGADGALAARAPSFTESLFMVDASPVDGGLTLSGAVEPARAEQLDLWDALVLVCATMWKKTDSSGCCWACPAVSIRRWFWPLP